MQLFLRYKSWQRENTLTCWFRLASANLVMLLRLVPSLNKLTVNKNDELLCKNSSSSMNCLKNDRIWKPRLVLRHPTWAYTLLLLVCCYRGFRLFAPSGSFRVLFYIMLRIPEISVGIQMETSVSVSSDRNIRYHLWSGPLNSVGKFRQNFAISFLTKQFFPPIRWI